VQKPDNFYRRR